MQTALLLAIGLLVAGLPAGAGASDGLSTLLRCGEREIEVTPMGQAMHLLAGFDRFELEPVPAASGARFEAPGDPRTWLWSKGGETTVQIKGERLPACVAEPFRASGNEPFWRIAIGPDGLLLDRLGEPALRAPAVAPAAVDGGRRWSFTADGATLMVEARPGLCRDSMSGMPHPASVTLTFAGRTLSGCGGDPGSLLRRRAWTVASLDGTALPSRQPLELLFGTGGRLAGQAPCNRILGSWRLTGEALGLGPLARTMMACPDRLMAAERRYTLALEAVRRFEPAGDGGLRLVREAGGWIELTP